jgi:hypothetical protein
MVLLTQVVPVVVQGLSLLAPLELLVAVVAVVG